ncbi:MAG TPA: hypothetical protein VFN03_06695, partial [Trueperaceae bacterium]|nr:hypothetical protein [Trueperaceae bacterium]
MGSTWRWRLALVMVAAVLAACGGAPPPDPADDFIASGTVILPPGSPLTLTDLRALGPYSASDLDTDGSFSVEMTDEGVGLVAVADASGQVVLLGYVDTATDGTDVSSRSTALAMLYFALGGLFREAELQERMVELLADDPIVDDLATELEVMLAADPAAIA